MFSDVSRSNELMVSVPFHSHSCEKWCQFVPPHILEDISICNGVSLDPPPHMGAMPNPNEVVRVVQIQQTAHHLRAHRIQAAVEPIIQLPEQPHIMGALGGGGVGPNFPVYDLNGATDLIDRFRVPEYKKALINENVLDESKIDFWPNNAKLARETALKVYEFFRDNFKRNSIDGQGGDIASAVRFRTYVTTFDPATQRPKIVLDRGKPIIIPENNAFWDGSIMAYGEGDGIVFNDFTLSQDVVAHELTHGITGETCNLKYENQSGALNEHISDVFGIIFKQYINKMNDPATANWFIGDDCISEDFKKMVNVRGFGHWHALRSMKDPGNAYSVRKDAKAADDRQPKHMDNYQNVQYDNGGVHINSGIPNKAFHLFSISLKAPAWDIPGKVWYQTIQDAKFGKIDNRGERVATFAEFRDATLLAVKQLYPQHQQNLIDAWKQVGL